MPDKAAAPTIGDEAELTDVVAPVVEEAPDIPMVPQPAVATKKVKPELTAEQRTIESKKRPNRHTFLRRLNSDFSFLW
jgi:hypothetical protein